MQVFPLTEYQQASSGILDEQYYARKLVVEMDWYDIVEIKNEVTVCDCTVFAIWLQVCVCVLQQTIVVEVQWSRSRNQK